MRNGLFHDVNGVAARFVDLCSGRATAHILSWAPEFVTAAGHNIPRAAFRARLQLVQSAMFVTNSPVQLVPVLLGNDTLAGIVPGLKGPWSQSGRSFEGDSDCLSTYM